MELKDMVNEALRDGDAEREGSRFNSKATNVLEAQDVIEGDVRCSEDLLIKGVLRGNLRSTASVKILGAVYGEVHAKNIEMIKGYVQGKVTVDGLLSVNEESFVKGDVKADNIRLGGVIKGNMEVGNLTALGAKAIAYGDIRTNYFEMQSGAVLNGAVKILSACYRDEDFTKERMEERLRALEQRGFRSE